MTSSTETITAGTTREGQADLFDLDAELADLTAADADSAAAAQAADGIGLLRRV